MAIKMCSIPGCETKRHGRGLCSKHYKRWYEHGNPLTCLNNRDMTPEQRLDRFTIKKDGCWGWSGSKCNGYGRYAVNGKGVFAHRMRWELTHGEIPQNDDYHGVCVLHKCDNPECTNPDHLFLGTHKDNMNDMVAKNRNAVGENTGSAKISNAKVRTIKHLISIGMASFEIADIFNVSQTSIYGIKSGRKWASI